ncbi:hypothetical protein [Haloechinothrix aidingensis]|uniref:hypothetical protein n=1 Tax=Haloechinothrix aidingensis TaxID=2752311 RepID=UPI001C60FAAB|nr:hypothetical protein [Haloechinothrix aidingensis]
MTTSGRQNIALWGLAGITAAGLVIDAVIHFRLASDYQAAWPDGIGGGTIFRIQAAVALLAALYVLVRRSRPSFAVAFLVAVSAFGAVLLYRYVDVPQLGPIPAMYEPIWFFEKSLSAVAEGIAALTAAIGVAVGTRSAAHRVSGRR